MISPKSHGSKTVEGLPNAAVALRFLGSCLGLGWLTWLLSAFQVPGEVFLPVPAGLLAARPARALLPKSPQGKSQVEVLGEGGWLERAERLIWLFCPCQEEIPRQLRCIALYLLHIAGAYLLK